MRGRELLELVREAVRGALLLVVQVVDHLLLCCAGILDNQQREILARCAPGVIPAHEHRWLGLTGVQGELLVLVSGRPLVNVVVVGIGERTEPGVAVVVAGRVHPHDAVVGRPLHRSQRTRIHRSSAVGGAVVAPARRVDDHLDPLVLHPFHRPLQIAPGAGIGDVQAGVGRHVHHGRGHRHAVAVTACFGAVVDVAGRQGHRLVTAPHHRGRQITAGHGRPQAREAVPRCNSRRGIDHADLHAGAGDVRVVPCAGQVRGDAAAGVAASVLVRLGELSGPGEAGDSRQSGQRGGGHERLDIAVEHVAHVTAVGGDRLDHRLRFAVESDRQPDHRHRIVAGIAGVSGAAG